MEAYQRAMEWWTTNAAGEGALLTPAEHAILGDGLVGEPTPEVRAVLGKLRPYLDLMRSGGLQTEYGATLDRSQGLSLMLPHLSSLRNAARALRLEAEVRMADGDVRGAVECMRATTGFSAHVRTDDILISSLVSAAIASMNDRTMGQLMGRGGIDAATANELAVALEALRGPDPLRIAEAIRSEAEMMRATVERSIEGVGEPIHELLGVDLGERATEMTPEKLREQLGAMDALYGEAAAAAVNPDREAAKAALEDIQRRVEAGEGGALAMIALPSFDRAVEAGWKIEDMIAERYRMLDDIRSGRVQAATLANAAYPYLTASARVSGLERPTQEALEAARLAYAALDTTTKQQVRRHLAALRDPLRAAFDEAAKRERCDFSVSRVQRPALLMRYLPGLRGAVRIVLTDAITASAGASDPVDPRSVRSDAPPFTMDEAVEVALRAAAHLASDPSIGHSMIAASIVNDATAALEEFAGGRPLQSLLSAERLEALRAASARLNGPDPIGLGRALDHERKLLIDALVRQSLTPEAAEGFLKRHSDDLAGALLLLQVQSVLYTQLDPASSALATTLDTIRGSDALTAPLLGFGDLVREEAVTNACTLLESWVAATNTAARDGVGSATPWMEWADTKPWPPAVDLGAVRDTASKALVRLESLLRVDSSEPRPAVPPTHP